MIIVVPMGVMVMSMIVMDHRHAAVENYTCEDTQYYGQQYSFHIL
jgi:hypothetical protein